MPRKQYSVEQNGKFIPLEIEWRGTFRNVTVRLVGYEAAVIPDVKALRRGHTLRLADGSTLEVKLHNSFMVAELWVLYNGQHVAGSDGHPETRLNTATGYVMGVGVLNLVIGVLAQLSTGGLLAFLQPAWPIILTGLIYIGLGYIARRQRSMIALGLAVTGFVLDGLFLFFSAATLGGSGSVVGGIVGRSFLLIPMLRGFGAIRELKAAERGAKKRITPKPPAALPTETSEWDSFLSEVDEVTGRPPGTRKAAAGSARQPQKKGGLSQLELALIAVIGGLVVLLVVVLAIALVNQNEPAGSQAFVPTPALPTVAGLPSGSNPTPLLTLPPTWTPALAEATATPPPTLLPSITPTLRAILAAPTASGLLPDVVQQEIPDLFAGGDPPATLPRPTPSRTPPAYASAPIVANMPLVKVIYDPATNRAYGLSAENRQLVFFDLRQRTVTGTAALNGEPSDACIDVDGEQLYTVNEDDSRLIAVVNLEQQQMTAGISWPAPRRLNATPDEPLHYHIFCQPDRLFLVDAAWAPQLWAIRLDDSNYLAHGYASPSILFGSNSSEFGIGDLVFTASGNRFYNWLQVGWGNGATASDVFQMQIEEESISVLARSELVSTVISRDPLNTPIFLDEASGRLVVKRLVMNANDLHEIYHVFDEDIYAVHWGRGQAAGWNHVYDLNTYAPIASVNLPAPNPTQMFYGTDGTLYILYGEVGALYYALPWG